MRDLTAAVVDAIHMAGFVEIEVSAKHVHLTQEDVEILFGKGAKLEPKRPLSQPGQFLSNQRVTLIGPKRKELQYLDRFAAPHRWNSQRATAWHLEWTHRSESRETLPAQARSRYRVRADLWK